MPSHAFIFLSVLTSVLGACAYDTHFEDCAVRCTTDACPVGLTCGAEGFCRTAGATETCTAVPSCVGLAKTCGPNADEDCCSTAMPIPGGTFFRSYDVAGDGMYPSMSYPATVSAFRLDKYEVTVGRFRKFVEAGMGTNISPPSAGAGAHAKISGSGWDASWNVSLATDTSTLIAAVKCDATYQTWTDSPGTNEDLPVNCVTWYEAMAFCVWDGGYLPTNAEWNFAAAGGDEQRAYPWSNPAGSTTIDCSHANYKIDVPSGEFCVNGMTGGVARVGNKSPKGDGKWEQADLGGNLWEWALDGFQDLTIPCNDCANLAYGLGRTVRSSSFNNAAAHIRGSYRPYGAPTFRNYDLGMRCAR